MPRVVSQEEEIPQTAELTEEEISAEENQVQKAQEQAQEEAYDSYSKDPNEKVWQDGPTWAQVNEWKDRFGEVYVTSVTPTTHVVWRTLTRFEYRNQMKSMEQSVASGQVSQAEASLNNEEQVAETCILFPTYSRTNVSTEMAGVASLITQQVMQASGFDSLDVRQL